MNAGHCLSRCFRRFLAAPHEPVAAARGRERVKEGRS